MTESIRNPYPDHSTESQKGPTSRSTFPASQPQEQKTCDATERCNGKLTQQVKTQIEIGVREGGEGERQDGSDDVQVSVRRVKLVEFQDSEKGVSVVSVSFGGLH